MIIGFTGFSFQGSTPSCPAYGTFLRTEGCNDIYADGVCGEYSQDNGSCPTCDGCESAGNYLRTEGCNDVFADGCCGEYSEDNGSCDPCAGCDPAGTWLRAAGCDNIYADGCCGEYSEPDPCCGCDGAGTLFDSINTPWANTVDAGGTDWNIYSIELIFTDGCCGTYSVKHWYGDGEDEPVELSSPDGGVSPNPPAGYVLTASAIYPSEPDGNTYATYTEDPLWSAATLTTEGSNQPWSSYKIVADGSGGSTNEQTVQDAGTVMSDAFIWMWNSKYVRYYATGTTYESGVYGIHPSFEIISCSAFGSNPTPYASNLDWRIEITLEELGTPFLLRVGTLDQDQVDNGECGRTAIDVSFTPELEGTLLYDETISSYYYYSDGAGGYYSTFYGE